MKYLTSFSKETVDVGRLAHVIREKGRPVPVNVLAIEAMREFLLAYGERRYAPGATYVVGERVLLDGQLAQVRAVRPGGNPNQGDFAVLTLCLLDGSERWMAAEVIDAKAQDRVVTEDQIRTRMKDKDGTRVRDTVREALGNDARFAWFQFGRGNTWCLHELLPEVGTAELRKVAAALPHGWEDGEPRSESTETLVMAVWGIQNDGSARYELAEFALSRALAQCVDVRNAGGDLWMWRAAWEAFAEREPIRGPQMPTRITVPEGVTEEAASTEQVEDAHKMPGAGEAEEEKDLEAWIHKHPTMGVFTLSAQQYYHAWLPLNKDLRKLFPPLDAGRQKFTLRLNLLGHQESLPAWVDMVKGQILGKKQLYDALRDQGIYPGARLRLTFVPGGEYELATRPATEAEPIRVLRIRLDDGQLIAEEFEEKRRYDVDDAVYVADARFEDLRALFQQAEEAGKSIFELMYERAETWWKAQGRTELRVTAARLFQEIHFDNVQGRMTSQATIAWELWRREAFQPIGSGEYRFRPEYGETIKVAARVFSVKPRPRKQGPKIVTTRALGDSLDNGKAEVEVLEQVAPQPAVDVKREPAAQRPDETAPQPEPLVSKFEVAAPQPDVAVPQGETAAQDGTAAAQPVVTEKLADEVGVAAQAESDAEDEERGDGVVEAPPEPAAHSDVAEPGGARSQEESRAGSDTGKAPEAAAVRQQRPRRYLSPLARFVGWEGQRMWNKLMGSQPISRLTRLIGRR
jgi:hypothetical protein